MDFALDTLLPALQLAVKVTTAGSLVMYLATLGNPRSLRESLVTLHGLKTWPPTALFRWRRQEPRDGYEVTAYNRDTDEDNTLFPVFHLAKWCPTSLLWPKRRQRTRDAMLRTARITLGIKVVFLVAFFLGSFAALVWLTFTHDWRWVVPLIVLVFHQLAYYVSNTFFHWLRWGRLLVITTGCWLYLQGGVNETAAIVAVGTILCGAILTKWQMVENQNYLNARQR
ncbi:hypothetical protein ACWGE0_37630 [Lentzea sp. NPDC054927]